MGRLIFFFIVYCAATIGIAYAGIAIDTYAQREFNETFVGFAIILAMFFLQVFAFTPLLGGNAIEAFLSGFYCGAIALVGVGLYSAEQSTVGLASPLVISFLFWDAVFWVKGKFD